MYGEQVSAVLAAIKKRRVELGYSQEFVASKLGISQNIYSKVESNQIKLTAERFVIICEVLQIDAGELLRKSK